MANQPKTAGVHTYSLYKIEDTYKTAVTTDKFLGLNTNFDVNITNELNPRRGSGGSSTSGRNIGAFATGTRSYNLTQDFDVTDFEFMEWVLGAVTGTTTKTYTTTDDTVSATVTSNISDVTDDQKNTFTGCVVQSCSLRAAVNDVLTCNLSVDAAHGENSTTLATNVARSTNTPYRFVGASIEIPTGTALNGIFDSVDITINNNYELYYGSEVEASYATKKELGVEVRAALKHVDSALITKVLGGDGSTVEDPTINTDLLLKFERGTKNVTFTLPLSPIASYNLTQALNQPVGEDVNITSSDISVAEQE